MVAAGDRRELRPAQFAGGGFHDGFCGDPDHLHHFRGRARERAAFAHGGVGGAGASRWQIVKTVVLPVASAGIFSALMVGLGRAVGETMIVVMATGNTPIMEWNIFNGMRTLSANIAVELPEAAVAFHALSNAVPGRLVLFLMTFALNTVAELLRQHLREKFKLV